MTISYIFSPEMLQQGAKKYLSHRWPVLIVLLPIIGIFFLLFGLNYLFGMGSPHYFSGGILCSVGFFYLTWPLLRPKRMVRDTFKANPNERTVTVTATDGMLSFVDGESTSTSPYSSYVDYKVCKGGLLLYPQKNLFIWIPATAAIESGTWQDFTDLIVSKITRKI